MRLSDAQNRILKCNSRVSQVIAAAGSGKTRTVVGLVEDRLARGAVRPGSVLILSFSRKACKELRTRLSPELRGFVEISTFHSLAYRTLHKYGLTNGKIVTDIEKRRYLRDFLRGRDTEGIPFELLIANKRQFRAHMPQLCFDAFRSFEMFKRDHGFLEFDDLVRGLLRNLRGGGLCEFRREYDLIIVDEFQDTDREQLAFLQAMNFRELFVVGDDYQSIYGFRGADPSIFVDFKKYFRGAKRHYLTENYRSLTPITDCGNRVISVSRTQIRKRVVSMRGRLPRLGTVTREIERGKEASLAPLIKAFPESRVLCRSNHRILAWRRAGIPQSQLCTIHSAKGCEFPIVFLDLVGGWSGSAGLSRLPEEEIRVSYVALSRAENLLVVLHSRYSPRDPERLVFEMFRPSVRTVGGAELNDLLHLEREYRASA